MVLRVVPVGVWRGSSPRGAVLGGHRWAATRWCGSVVAPRMRGTSAGSAEPQRPAQKPNPALHLTPPSAAVVVLTVSWRCR
ncbi:hypothetical protein C1280_11750 [Gemmata obscuriglobus]|uniref:Uncharacterized protein n=1 Tax=Gemmata obscuriglobus TaxID=114 RepID=A0A2Z3HF91_9BACT|nr:hypothetical protein C1280_11750 [Gemmata obscuriglobus]